MDRPEDRDVLCRLAMGGDRIARTVTVQTGHLPSRREDVAPFLFLTEQWDRYDDADPDGRQLRKYAGKLHRYDELRDRLCAAADNGGRDRPCTETDRSFLRRSGATAHGVSGSGGFGHGVSVH
ncbi:hypothetical protein [Micromonospora endolithica]|nr:hypothetical protein [Micromonospora endolithica]